MAKTKLPDPLTRRHLLEGELDPTKAAEIAQAYLEAGRELDAIGFFALAEDRDALGGLRSAALERGDVFLMKAVCSALDEEASPQEWQTLASAAAAAGRQSDAESAQRLATVDV